MNTLFRNFFHTLIRNKYSTALNLIGLSVAFAAFTVILMEVQYRFQFDRHYPDAERIYQVYYNNDSGDAYTGSMSRIHADKIIHLSGNIESGAYYEVVLGDTRVFATKNTTLLR